LVAPAQQSALERSEPLVLFGGAAAGKVCEGKHTLDVVAAALEASTYLAGDNACRREPTNSTFEGSEVLEIVHEFYGTASGASGDDARRASASQPEHP
jgi:hypothetical protein